MDTRTFFDIMGTAPATVTVVSTLDGEGRPYGLTVAALSSVSADPPMLLVCVDLRSRTLPVLRARGAFVVNFLRGDRADLAARFASRLADRFHGVDWRPGELGLPVLERHILAYAECSTIREIEAGDHAILIATVVAGAPPPAGSRPLMYFRHGYEPWPGDAADASDEPAPDQHPLMAQPSLSIGARMTSTAVAPDPLTRSSIAMSLRDLTTPHRTDG